MSGQPTNFLNIGTQKSDTAVGSVGGHIKKFLTASTLLIGDVVYLSALNTVAKSTTNANYAAFIGIVMGGQTFDPAETVASEAEQVGDTAAVDGQWVLVQIEGIGLVKSDGAILVGSLCMPDLSVAGECDVAGANPNYTLGIAIEAIPDGSAGRMLIRQSYNEA